MSALAILVLVASQLASAPPKKAPPAPPPAAPQAAAPDPAPPPAPPAPSVKRMAVMKTDVSGDVDAALGPQITARLAEEIRKQQSAEVISSDEIVALLKHEKEKAILGECKEEESCMAELAQALGADVVVSAKLSTVKTHGDGAATSLAMALAVSAVDARSASVVGRVNEAWGGDVVTLLQLVRPVVTKLFATSSIPKGNIEVVGAVPGSKILVDDEARGSAELPRIADLLVGGHHVVVQHPDKQPFEKWVVVEDGKTTSVAAAQVAMGDDVFGSWWFWTAAGAGVAVAGATAAGIALLVANGSTGVNVQLNAAEHLGGAR